MTYALCYYSIPASVSLFNREMTKERADDIASFVRAYVRDRDAELLKVHQYCGELEIEERNADAPPITLLVVSVEIDLAVIENWKNYYDLISDKVYQELKTDDLNLSHFSEDDDFGTIMAYTKCYD